MRTIRDCSRIHATRAIGSKPYPIYRTLLIAAFLCGYVNSYGQASTSDGEATQEAEGNGDQAILEWIPVGEAQWNWIGSEVTASRGGPDGMLITSRHFSDFRLRVEFKPDAEVNSGVFIRCQNPNEITPFTCYEINIWDRHPNQEFRTGAIVARAFPPLAHLGTIGKWNVYEISARGDTITVHLNGVKVAELQDSTLSSGFIALQRQEAGEISFRNIAIEEW